MIDTEINKNRVYIDTNGDMIYLPFLCNKHEEKFLNDKHEKNFLHDPQRGKPWRDRKKYIKFHKMYFDE